MHRRGRIYWLTWALLVLGAAATGVASIQDAFFRGAIAAFLAPIALPLYERAGPRLAAFLGLLTGVLWQLGLTYGYGAVVWSDTLRAYAMSRLEIDLSVAAAAFAGAALAAALVHRTQRFVQAATLGTVLALAMTALPYGFIRSSETARLGPVEVTWLAPAEDIGEDGRPIRPKGVEVPALSAEDREFLRQAFLVIDVAGETALVDTEGRRLWAVWRNRLHQPGHEDGPVRRVFVALMEPKRANAIADNRLGSFCLALPEAPDGALVIEHDPRTTKVVAGDGHSAKIAPFSYKYEYLELSYSSWFSRMTDNWLRDDPGQPKGQHADVFLLLKDVYPFKLDQEKLWSCKDELTSEIMVVDGPGPSPMLWALRREPLETFGEACERPIPPSDRIYLRNYGESGRAPLKRDTQNFQIVTIPDIPAPSQPHVGGALEKVQLPATPAEPAAK